MVRGGQQSELMPTNRRIESFSDAVFAIVVTIMVLEIHIPDSFALAIDERAFQQFGGTVAAYALSFLVIANLWTSHHYLVFTLSRPARSTLWFNNLLLFCVSLIPLTTSFLGRFPSAPRAAAAFGLVAVACTASFMLLRSHAARVTHNEVHRGIHQRVLRLSWLFLAIYAASVPLAFVSPWLAWACFVVVPPMLFLPIIRATASPKPSPQEHRGLEHSCP